MNSSLQLDQRSPAPRRHGRRAIWILGALGLVVPSCVLDTDDKCGPNQELLAYADESERCVCVAGTAYTAEGCQPCGENEMASAAGCLCVAGYVRLAATDPCTPLPADAMPPTGQDSPCSTADDCAGFEASFCDNFVSFSCLVPDCSLPPQDSCSPGKECCDLTNFGLPMTLCIAAGACQR